jgi:hypothetical protein
MMSESFNEPEVPASSFGDQVRANWLAGLQRNADNMTAASMAAHAAGDHQAVTSGQGGLFGPGATGQQLAAEVAARRPRVGDGAGAGRDLEALGGAWDIAATTDSPCPGRADLRYVNTPNQRPTGESPLAAFMRGRQ